MRNLGHSKVTRPPIRATARASFQNFLISNLDLHRLFLAHLQKLGHTGGC